MGPCKVIEVLSEAVYKIKWGKQQRVVHGDALKLAREKVYDPASGDLGQDGRKDKEGAVNILHLMEIDL